MYKPTVSREALSDLIIPEWDYRRYFDPEGPYAQQDAPLNPNIKRIYREIYKQLYVPIPYANWGETQREKLIDRAYDIFRCERNIKDYQRDKTRIQVELARVVSEITLSRQTTQMPRLKHLQKSERWCTQQIKKNQTDRQKFHAELMQVITTIDLEALEQESFQFFISHEWNVRAMIDACENLNQLAKISLVPLNTVVALSKDTDSSTKLAKVLLNSPRDLPLLIEACETRDMLAKILFRLFLHYAAWLSHNADELILRAIDKAKTLPEGKMPHNVDERVLDKLLKIDEAITTGSDSVPVMQWSDQARFMPNDQDLFTFKRGAPEAFYWFTFEFAAKARRAQIARDA